MTRKDFELIAEVLRDAVQEVDTLYDGCNDAQLMREREREHIATRRIAQAFSRRLGRTNARFNADRFLRAAGVR